MLGPDEVVGEIVKGSQEVPLSTQKLYGIIPRAIHDIFTIINKEVESNKTQFSLKVNYYEIYNE
jgi:hypothetical protein